MSTRHKLAAISQEAVAKDTLNELREFNSRSDREEIRALKTELQTKIAKIDAIKEIHKNLEKRKSSVFKSTGSFSFPTSNHALIKILQHIDPIKKLALSLIIAAFFMHVFFYQIGFKSIHSYGSLISNVIFSMLILSFYIS